VNERLNYEWDVFLSYRREYEWPQWVKEHFKPLFEQWLALELRGPPGPRVYFDADAIEAGRDWPDDLAAAHASSAVLVPLLTAEYPNSAWCNAEFSLMLQREEQCGYATPRRRDVLIVPALIHDGEDLEPQYRRRQGALLQDLANTRMARNGEKAEELSDRIKAWVPSVARAVKAAPPPEKAWLENAVGVTNRVFATAPARQLTKPGFNR
jgi:hypothetical protein